MCEKSLIKSAKFLSTFTLLLLNVSLNAQIQANFTADTTNGCGSVTVNFTNTSSVSGTSYDYNWDFGNGNTSTLENPSAIYSTAGNYDVQLIVSNANGTDSDTLNKTNYITVYKLPNANFSFTPSGGCSPITVNFTNSSTVGDAPFVSNRWVFADGSQPFVGTNAIHTYQTAGKYLPSLEVIDQNGCRDFAVNDTVIVTQSPQARFTTLNSRISCQSPYTANFKSNSTGFNLTYKWYFGDGDSSSQASPSHTYDSMGRYDVTLIVNDPNCSDTLLLSEYVILENSVADFSILEDTICLGNIFSPIDNSQGAAIFSWNFGDGTQKNGKNVSHSYQDSGHFVITLTVSAGSACTDTYSDSIYVQKVTADFVTDSTYTCQVGERAHFYYDGINGNSFHWRIGIPDSSIHFSGDSISIPQLDTGIFSDTLIVFSKIGCSDTLIKKNNRKVQRLVAEFLANGNAYSSNDTIGGCSPLSINFTDASYGPGIINQWEWTFNSDTVFEQNPTYTFIDDSIYQVTLTIRNNLGCFDIYQRYVQSGFKQNPQFTFFPDTICVNDTVFIVDQSTNSSRIDKYIFQLISKDLQSSKTYSIGTNNSSGVYFTNIKDVGDFRILLSVFDNDCDTNTTSINSFHVGGPVSDISADATIDCSDRRTVQFTGNIEGATRFFWNFGDGSPLDSINENPLHNFPQKKVYRIILTTYNDTNNCAPFKDTIDLNLGSIPPIQITPDSMEYCLNSKVEFFAVDSSIYPSVFWIIDGDTVSEQKDLKLLLDERGTFEIKLLAIDALGCPSVDIDTLFVSQPQPNFSSELLKACLPMDVIFKDSSDTDTTISSWRWTFGNGDTSYQSIDTVTYYNPGLMDVSLRIENIFGCADSIYKEDYLNTSNFSVNFSQSKVVICEGDSVTFRNSSSGNKINYTWIFGTDTIQSNDNEVTHTFTQADTFDIILIGINELGCKIIEAKAEALVVGTNPQADFVADTLQSPCYPLEVNFADLSTGNVSQWHWRFGDGNSSALPNPLNRYTSLGSFDVFLKVTNDAGCEDSTLKIDYIQTNGPAADIQISKDTACINEAITFSLINQQNVNNIKWDFGDGTASNNAITSHAFQRTGTIYFTLSLYDDQGLCQVNIRDSVHIFEISADFSVSDDTACQPHRAIFTALSPGASQLFWDFGDGNTSTDPVAINTYQSPGTFTARLSVNSQLGCKDTTKQEILVHPKPQADRHNDTTICYGDTIQLWAKGGTEYHWNNEHFLSDNSSSTPFAWPDTNTTFRVEVLNEFNCIDTAYTTVNVQPPPIENPLNYSDTNIIIGEHLDLDATAGDNLNYSWNPKDDLSCSDCPNPRAQPLKNTTYIVTISDPYGCFSFKDTIFIEVIEKYSLEVPNAFSPNGDGNNDIIYAKGWGLKELIAFKIYNRYGELVFESNDFDHGWDGSYKGKPQNIETYVYTVEAETYSGKVLSRKGNISLLR